jgi:hypothetical protein
LLATYRALPGTGRTVLRVEMLMMRPPSGSVLAAYCMAKNGPLAFTAMTRS